MNFLKAQVVSLADGSATLSLAGGQQVQLLVGNAGLTQGQALTVGVRPQHLAVTDDQAGPKVKLRLVEALGSETVIHGEIAGEKLMAVLPGQQPYRAGDEVRLDLAAAPLHLFGDDDLRILSVGGKAAVPAL